MTHRGPVRIGERRAFDALIDARSPSEFALDHIPGSINCPVLDDDERAIVGTLYKQQGSFEARRVGGAMVATNLARHLREQFSDRPESWKPLVYCWRGGMRSGSMVTWLRLVGWDAQQLAGGYKSFRHHVLNELSERIPRLALRVICGATGSAKTRLLKALSDQGAQVLDLEACASHKGSMLGDIPGVDQPSQKQFDTRVFTALEQMDLSKPVFVEGESPKIGKVSLPLELVARMRGATCIEIVASNAERLSFLLRDYAYLGDDLPALIEKIARLKEQHGKESVQRWQHWAEQGDLPQLFNELMTIHYDPHYSRSQQRHFTHWDRRVQVGVAQLDEAGLSACARSVLAIPA